MPHSREFLRASERLAGTTLFKRFSEGDIIARGYADIGFEEFVVVAGQRMVSTVNGTLHSLPESGDRHFFLLPSLDRILTVFAKQGLALQQVDYVDQRAWRVECESQESGSAAYKTLNPCLRLALLELLLSALKMEPQVQTGRSLSVSRS